MEVYVDEDEDVAVDDGTADWQMRQDDDDDDDDDDLNLFSYVEENVNSVIAAYVILYNIVETAGEVLTSHPPQPAVYTVDETNLLTEDQEKEEREAIKEAFHLQPAKMV
ncbi:hypothetical protein JD844_032790 [Phrynosoma platyrhinos]|uniref:Uncharacterized protein n=1 Tax=Phrynosoma platyrhinos TaxID=52577 RepID=A0ABQ7T680_PHRPL|nr:hypothetical protein JD844_032790 [Phrynosoma platyrhinos]